MERRRRWCPSARPSHFAHWATDTSNAFVLLAAPRPLCAAPLCLPFALPLALRAQYKQVELRNGDRYSGWFDNEDKKLAKRHGGGVCKYVNGDQYIGGWRSDMRFGHGRIAFKNGDKYEGAWLDDVIHGSGAYKYSEGEYAGAIYIGEFKDGARHGRGKMLMKDRSMYDGFWEDGDKHGKGLLTTDTGEETYGEWGSGQFIRDLEDWEIDELEGYELYSDEDDDGDEDEEEARSCANVFTWGGMKRIFSMGDDSEGGKKKKEKKKRRKSTWKPDDQNNHVVTDEDRKRRVGISAEATETIDMNGERVVNAKSDADRDVILDGVDKNFLFDNCTQDQLDELVDAMFEVSKEAGETVITQGEEGDYFYIIANGSCDVSISKDGATPQVVASMGAGDSFGEISLMYSMPRTATITTKSACKLWALDRGTFRRILVGTESAKAKRWEGFLNNVELLSGLTAREKSELADALEPVDFYDEEFIITQGDLGDTFYIVESGECIVTQQKKPGKANAKKAKEIARVSSGQYFGEKALLNDEPRAANVIASGDVRCLRLNRDCFVRLLGPVEHSLKKGMASYE